MSIDTRARTAGENLRASATTGLDLERSLDDLTRTVRHRRWMQAGAVCAAAVLAAVAAGITVAHVNHRASTPPASNVDRTTPVDAVGCAMPAIDCGDGSVTVALPVPVSWQVTKGFGHNIHVGQDSETSRLVHAETYQQGSSPAGVTVAEDVRAVKPSRLARIDHSVQPTAEALATWVAGHPWLETSGVRQTTIDGMPAWSVSARVTEDRELPALCNYQIDCLGILTHEGGRTSLYGIWPELASEYTFVDVEGAGPSVIWSWSEGGPGSFERNDRMIDTIHVGD